MKSREGLKNDLVKQMRLMYMSIGSVEDEDELEEVLLEDLPGLCGFLMEILRQLGWIDLIEMVNDFKLSLKNKNLHSERDVIKRLNLIQLEIDNKIKLNLMSESRHNFCANCECKLKRCFFFILN